MTVIALPEHAFQEARLGGMHYRVEYVGCIAKITENADTGICFSIFANVL